MNLTRTPRGNYIQGLFRIPEDPNGEVRSRSPGNLDQGDVSFPFSYEHVHQAITSAKHAYLSWSRMNGPDRAAILARYRNTLKERAEEVAHWIAFEVGKPLWEAKLEIADTLSLIDYFLKSGSQTSVEIKVSDMGTISGTGSVRFVPRGVMGVIFSESLPLYHAHSHFIPALLHGNTVVVKSPKWIPMLGQTISEIIHDSGVPAGTFNLLQGDGEVGRRLIAHPELDGVLFNGAFETASRIRKQLLSDYWKIFVLDTGGKNSTIVWSDADYEKALYETFTSALITCGQRLTSCNRVLLHDSIFDRFVADLHELFKKCSVGWSLQREPTFMGSLIDDEAVENYLRFQGIAVREGAEEIMRGKPLERNPKGYYVSPSIHYVKKPNPKGVYETSEIFGPNVAVYRVKELEESADIINHSPHGLVGSIYTKNRSNFLKMLEQIEVGMFHLNKMTIERAYLLPCGGIKQSGNGHPMGSFSGYQCTHPLSSIESTGPADFNELPKEIPRLGK